jgi:site-specific recombinase XerD
LAKLLAEHLLRDIGNCDAPGRRSASPIFNTGARIETGCRLKVPDFHQDGDEATLRFHIKGGHVKTNGIHFSAAQSIAEYIKAAGIESGPLFRPRLSQHHETLAARRMTERSMYRILMSYLERLPGAIRETVLPGGEKTFECMYSPHSLRATTATLLLDSSVAIESVQDLLDHKYITTTQIYDKRRRSVRDSASHKVPFEGVKTKGSCAGKYAIH